MRCRELSKEEMSESWVFSSDGSLIWRKHYFKRYAGQKAGCTNKAGYRVVKYQDIQYKIHRLVYAYHTGNWPKVIDHINGDRSDNRIENLREVTHVVNSQNTTKICGAVKYRGVSYQKGRGRPRAFVQYAGKREFLGYFDSEEQASVAYENRRRMLCPPALIN